MMTSNGLNITFDEGRHWRGKVGFVLLATEQTVADDMLQIIPEGVGLHFSRVAIPDSITIASLTQLVSGLSAAAQVILPDGSLDVITYACTSGSLVVGEGKVFAELNKGAPKAHKTCIITSVLRALKAVKAKRIVVATPYLDEINSLEKMYVEASGFEVLDIQGLQIEKDSDMVRVTPESILQFAISLDRADADTIFISCGALRSIDIIDRLEQLTGKTVITSNQAMAWDVMRLAGVNDSIAGFGWLLRDF